MPFLTGSFIVYSEAHINMESGQTATEEQVDTSSDSGTFFFIFLCKILGHIFTKPKTMSWTLRRMIRGNLAIVYMSVYHVSYATVLL